MPGVPFFIPAPVDDRSYDPFARRSSTTSILRRPSSAKSNSSKRPSSAKSVSIYSPSNRPSSAKPLQRPSSASTYSYRPQSAKEARSELDYMGVSNLMKSLTFKKSRCWREKSPENNDDKVHKQEPPKKRVIAWKEKEEDNKKTEKVDNKKESCPPKQTRSLQFSKFKYPQQYHYGVSNKSRVFNLEKNIPQCLRRGPRYCNQPLRQDCNFQPHNSVTHLKWHSIRSGTIPPYKGKAQKAQSEPGHFQNVQKTDDSDDFLSSGGNRTGSFQYVYEDKIDENLDVIGEGDYQDDFNNNQIAHNAVVQVLNSEGETDDESEENVPARITATPCPPAEEPDQVIEEEPDFDSPEPVQQTGLFRSSIQREEDDAESIHSVNENDNERDVDRKSDKAESVRSESSRSSKISGSSKRSKKSSQSNNVKFLDSENLLGFDADEDDPIDDYLKECDSPRKFRRSSGSAVNRESKFRKTFRYKDDDEPVDEEITEDLEDHSYSPSVNNWGNNTQMKSKSLANVKRMSSGEL